MGELTWVRYNLRDGGRADVCVPTDAWFRRPRGDDIAVPSFMFDDVEVVRHFAIPIEWLAKQDHRSFLGTTPSLWDVICRLRDATRTRRRLGSATCVNRQTAARMAGPNRPREQASLVVEARTYGGYSGSPARPTGAAA